VTYDADARQVVVMFLLRPMLMISAASQLLRMQD
jgi:hypothetical protein